MVIMRIDIGDFVLCVEDEPHMGTDQKLLNKGFVYICNKIVGNEIKINGVNQQWREDRFINVTNILKED